MAIRVLIIDSDIPFMVRVKQALDETNEFSVSISANGLAAEDALRHHRHDIAVIDFAIPDADAAALIAQLRHVQPGLPIIVCPTTDEEHAAAKDLAVQGVLDKPYTARELIALVRRIVPRDPRAEPPHADDFLPPEMPPGLRHLLDQARPADGVEDQPPEEDAAPEDKPAWDDIAAAYHETDLLDQSDEPVPTAQLPETETLDDLLEREWGRPRGLHAEPPVQPDDTPTVPDHDLDSIRQFLATDYQGHDSSEFSEVLDAVAHAAPDEAARPPHDEFHELVESLRISEPTPASRGPLEDLLTSMAAEQAAQQDEAAQAETSSTLDYVLNAIRRGGRPSEGTPGEEPLADDETIGEVMSGLFEPSFEGVLAAMAGEDVDEDGYGDEAAPGGEAPPDEGASHAHADVRFGDFLAEDDPAWLVDYRAGGIVPDDELAAEEPDNDEEDSSYYPATQALNAVSDADAPEFSLDALLEEIEQRLPLSETARPRLKPLPSWNQSELSRDASRLSALLDRQAGPDDEVPPPPDEMFREPPVSKEDTQPSQMVLDELNRLVGEPVMPRPDPTAPSRAEVWDNIEPPTDIQPPLEDERTRAHMVAPAGAGAWTPEADEAALAELFEDVTAPHPAPGAEDAVRSDEELAGIFEELLADAAQAGEAAAAGPDQPEDEERVEEDAAWGWTDKDSPQAAAWEAASADESGADEEAPAPLDDVIAPEPEQPEVELTPATPPFAAAPPVAARAPDLDDDAVLAQLAVQLTQFSLESSSQAILLTRGDERLAEAGDLPPAAMDRLFAEIGSAWQSSTVESDTLMRYIRLPEAGEFLLYSMLVEDGLLLSMAFHAGTSIRAIRRQARRLSASLASVPEDATEADRFEPPADIAWDTAPTGPQAIEDLREAAEQALEQAATGHPAREAAPAQGGTTYPAAPDEPAITYTCLWLVRDPALELTGDLAEDLNNWLVEVTNEAGGTLHQLAITGDSVLITLSIPQKTPPDAVILQLMDETARAAAAYYPERVDEDRPLWADGYYLITPPRDLSDREIARFASYQYQD